MKIAFFDAKPYDIESFKGYAGDISFKFFETRLNNDTVGLAKGYDGICVFVNDVVDAPVIERLVELGIKVIALRCAGYNNIDFAALRGRIPVAHVPAYSPYAVAEHTMAMLLTSVRRVHKAYIRTKDFNFSLSGLTGFDLHGKTVGIIGTGKIGSVFADICTGFGMRVIAYDKRQSDIVKAEYVSLRTLFSSSDIISLHCPLTPDTHHIINSKSIACMKKGVMLLNTSRGALIDAEALLEGIKSRQIGGACLDVYEEESELFFEDLSGHIIGDDVLARLISMPNVIVTSHQAFLTTEALGNIAKTTTDNIVKILSERKCENVLFPHS